MFGMPGMLGGAGIPGMRNRLGVVGVGLAPGAPATTSTMIEPVVIFLPSMIALGPGIVSLPGFVARRFHTASTPRETLPLIM